VPAKVLGVLDVQSAAPVDYVAERDVGKPPAQRGSCRVVEDSMTITGKRKTDPVLHLRLTNLDPAQVAAAEVLARYKGQEVVECCYGVFVGPLAVAPLLSSPTGASKPWSP
jgi:hypothetical protein